MNLFFMAGTHPDDLEMDLSLFVWAPDKDLAIALWKDWCEVELGVEDGGDAPERVFIVPCDRPDGQQTGVLNWHSDVVEA